MINEKEKIIIKKPTPFHTNAPLILHYKTLTPKYRDKSEEDFNLRLSLRREDQPSLSLSVSSP